MAKEKQKVWVASQHMQYGRRFSKTSCPVALSLEAKGFQNVSVDLDRITAVGLDVQTPASVCDAIMAIDEGRHQSPFGFELPC